MSKRKIRFTKVTLDASVRVPGTKDIIEKDETVIIVPKDQLPKKEAKSERSKEITMSKSVRIPGTKDIIEAGERVQIFPKKNKKMSEMIDVNSSRGDVEEEYDVRNDRIMSPGKFEGEHWSAPIWYARSLDSSWGEDIYEYGEFQGTAFELDRQDYTDFDIGRDKKTVFLTVDNSGFVSVGFSDEDISVFMDRDEFEPDEYLDPDEYF